MQEICDQVSLGLKRKNSCVSLTSTSFLFHISQLQGLTTLAVLKIGNGGFGMRMTL